MPMKIFLKILYVIIHISKLHLNTTLFRVYLAYLRDNKSMIVLKAKLGWALLIPKPKKWCTIYVTFWGLLDSQ